jgi:hypothetical protein
LPLAPLPQRMLLPEKQKEQKEGEEGLKQRDFSFQ